MNETLHRILTAAAALEAQYGKDAYNAGSIAKQLSQEIGFAAVMTATRTNTRFITEGKKSGCYTLTAAGREALSAPVTDAPEVVAPAAPALGYSSTDYRRVVDSNNRMAVGTVFQSSGRSMIVTAFSNTSWYLSHSQIEAEGLWDLDGLNVTYMYYRPAPVTPTTEPVQVVAEVAPVAGVAPLSIEAAAEQIIRQVSGQRVTTLDATERAVLLYTRPGSLGSDLIRVYAISKWLVGVQAVTADGSAGGGWRTVTVYDLPAAVRAAIEAAL